MFPTAPPQLNVTVAQLRDALEMVDPDRTAEPDTPIVLSFLPARMDTEGEWMKAGLYVWFEDYPEEGCIGPLGETDAI